MFSYGKRKGISEKKVVIIITMIREEAAHFNVDITDYFERILFNLEKTEIYNYIIEQKKISSKSFSALDENNCVASVIQQYVDAIINNIGLFF